MREWIGYYKDILSDELSSNLALNSKGWKQSTFANEKGNIGSKGSLKRVVMDETYVKENMTYWVDLINATRKVVNLYQKKHPYMKYFNPNRTTDFKINKYGKGGFMSEHADNIHHSHGQQYGYPHLTSLIFLNDEYDGGDFILCDGKFIAPKQQGSAVVFPSNFMYPHEVKEVTSGNRYSIMTWLL